jgi:hypothetical protein
MVEWMLSRYFSSWSLQRYLDSYRLLDDAIRARVPYGKWRRQPDRQRIEPDDDLDITFTPPLTTTDILQPLGTVLTATIAMTGHYTLPGGRLETRHSTGTWPIAYRPFAIEHSNGYVSVSYGWVILTDTLYLVPEPSPTATPRPTQTATRTPFPTRTPLPTPTMSASHITTYTVAHADHGGLAIDSTLSHTTDGGTTWHPRGQVYRRAAKVPRRRVAAARISSLAAPRLGVNCPTSRQFASK